MDTLSSRPPDKLQPGTPSIDPKFLRQRLSILAWARVGLGALAGVLAGAFNFLTLTPANPNQQAYYGLYLAVIVYLLSYYLAKYWLVPGIPARDKNKLITQGIGSFIMMFLFVWILYNTNCYLGGVGCFHI